MKVLNLDNLVSPKRTLVIEGKEYEVKDMTVEDFIESNKDAKTLEDTPNDTVIWMETTVRHIRRSIPGLTEEQVRGFKMEWLGAIVKFINGELEAEAAKAQPESAAAAGEQGNGQPEAETTTQ